MVGVLALLTRAAAILAFFTLVKKYVSLGDINACGEVGCPSILSSLTIVTVLLYIRFNKCAQIAKYTGR